KTWARFHSWAERHQRRMWSQVQEVAQVARINVLRPWAEGRAIRLRVHVSRLRSWTEAGPVVGQSRAVALFLLRLACAVQPHRLCAWLPRLQPDWCEDQHGS